MDDPKAIAEVIEHVNNVRITEEKCEIQRPPFTLWMDRQIRSTIGTTSTTKTDINQVSAAEFVEHMQASLKVLEKSGLLTASKPPCSPKFYVEFKRSDRFHIKCHIEPESFITAYNSIYDAVEKAGGEVAVYNALQSRHELKSRYLGCTIGIPKVAWTNNTTSSALSSAPCCSKGQ